MIRNKGYIYINWVWILLFGVGFALFLCVMPKYSNDYWYMMHLKPWFDAGGAICPEDGGDLLRDGVPWQGIFGTWAEHYAEDNIRLPNLLVPFFLLLPKWVGSGLMTLLLLWTLLKTLRICGVDLRRSPLVPLALFAWTFFLPWQNHMGSLDFQFNYIIPSALAIWLLGLLTAFEPANSGRGWRQVLKCSVAAFLLGVSHEGIAVPVICSLALLPICFRSWRRADLFVSLAAIVAGVLLLVSVPGMQTRAGLEMDIARIFSWNRIQTILSSYGLLLQISIGAFLLFLFYWYRTKKRHLISSESIAITLFFVVSALVCFFIVVSTDSSARTGYWMQFCSVAALVAMLRAATGSGSDRYRLWSLLLVTPLALLMCVHLVYVDRAAFRYRAEMLQAFADYGADRKPYVFSADSNMTRQPAFCADRPDADFRRAALLDVPAYLNGSFLSESEDYEWPVILPECMSRVTAESGSQLPGGSGMRIFENVIFMPAEKFREHGYEGTAVTAEYPIQMDFGKGYRTAMAKATEFTSPADGKSYVCLQPEIPWYIEVRHQLRACRLEMN